MVKNVKYYSFNNYIYSSVFWRFTSVSLGAIGLNSPLPVAVNWVGSREHSSTRKITTFVALFVDNSQLVGKTSINGQSVSVPLHYYISIKPPH